MRHTAAKQPAPPLPESTQQVSELRERAPERVSDIALASDVAQAVRKVPGVVDLSAGHVALAATYGSGQRVTGVVVHHLSQDEVVLEVHVILSEAHCTTVSSGAASRSAGSDSDGFGLLNDMASRIRGVVYDVVKDMPSLVLVRADVLIDDLR